MKIENTTIADIPAIMELYAEATELQKTVGIKSWKGFETEMVQKEILEDRHYNIVDENTISCTFLIAFNNPLIWKDLGDDKAIYLHRVATSTAFRGRSYMKKIVAWAIDYARDNNLNYIRLDTHSGNPGLTKYYESCGFTEMGIRSITWTPDLPVHYKDGPFSIFEIAL